MLHSFGGSGDGKYPYASLINVNGALYGTTTGGGAKNYGTVFSLSP
ncbi:MAG: choice-of-anchor tandem repeat GloVer-containing protein [Candidatus Cybelea sp.]